MLLFLLARDFGIFLVGILLLISWVRSRWQERIRHRALVQ